MPLQKWTDDEICVSSLIKPPFQMQCRSRFRLREINCRDAGNLNFITSFCDILLWLCCLNQNYNLSINLVIMQDNSTRMTFLYSATTKKPCVILFDYLSYPLCQLSR